MLDFLFPCFSLGFQVFGYSKLVLEAKKVEILKFNNSRRLKEPKRKPYSNISLIGATSGDLINLRGVLIILSCFCFTLRTMFITSLGGLVWWC